MNKGKQILTSPIIEISSKDNVTKEITMLVHKLDAVNGNGLDFEKSYTESYMNSLVNKPVVCKYHENIDDLGTHEQVLDDEGNIIGLETIAIGTITEVWTDTIPDEEGVEALYAKADLWNYKYPEIVACVEKLFNAGVADSSVEVEIYKYGDNPTQDYRVAVEYSYLANCLLSSTTQPADSDAGVISIAQLEIATAIKNDLKNIKKEEKGENELSKKEAFNKDYTTKFHFEASELNHDEIRRKINDYINPKDEKTGERDYQYYIKDIYASYFIVESYESDELYRVNYTIKDNIVIISADWKAVKLAYQATDGSDDNKEVSNTTKEELTNVTKEVNEELIVLRNKNEELEKRVNELNSTVVQQQELKVKSDVLVAELNSTVEELSVYKVKVETAEKEAQLTELSEKYSKLLSEETFKSEDVQNAIQELNSQKLNEIVVAEVSKAKVDIEVASVTNKDIVVNAKLGEDLIPQNILQKYGINA